MRIKIRRGSTNVLFATLGFVLAVCAYPICYGKAKFKPSVIENAKRSVVAIESRSALTAYNPPGQLYGSGVVIDKEAGYILTSGIVVGPSMVAEYRVDFLMV